MRRDLSAVTVHTNGRRVDVTLPNAVPLLELTPSIADLCGIDGDDARPAAWTLARPGRAPLPLTTTLAEAGVLDGEVLHLVDTAAWASPRVVSFDDPIATAAVAEGERPAAALRGTALAVFGGALLVTGAVVAAAVPALRASAGPALLAAAAALLTVAYLLPGAAGRAPRSALACGAWAMAFVAGWSLLGRVPHAGLAGGGLLLLAAGLAARPLARAAVPGVTVFAAGITAASTAITVGARPDQAAAAVAVAATVALRIGPKLISARLARRVGQEPDRVEALTRRSRTLLVSGAYGCVALAVAASAVLAATGGGYALGLAAMTGCSLAVRAATFRYVREALPPAIGAGATAIASVAGLAGVLAADGWAGAAVVAAGATGAGAALAAMLTHGRPDAPRRVAALWAMVDGTTAPLALGAMGVLAALSSLAAGVFG